ncbi:hypothetical protein [Paraliobacillus sp. X-1268]|uniref:hypothetical protein n=1 Tax=Paraliobacillus sp. X-1268 TaxID=2213193 RepID=UPI000E3E4E9C|nr:hypothetical protein [Paraliobacillus sp. X-1268]
MKYKLKLNDVEHIIAGVDEMKNMVCRNTELTIFEVDDMYYDEFISIYERIIKYIVSELQK